MSIAANRSNVAPDSATGVRSQRAPRRIEGLGRAGFTIVAVASLVVSLNQTTQSMVARPAEWLGNFFEALAVNAVIGVAILLAAVWARHRQPTPGPRQYATAFVAVTVAAFVAAVALELWNIGGTLGTDEADSRLFFAALMVIGGNLVHYAFVGIVITAAWLYTRTEADHVAAIAQCAVDSARMDEQTAEARLQMLEAQIEPHFLFNTLAHVKRLYETDHEAGARMLRNLKTYLAVALPQMRATDGTLARELDYTIAYLDIQQIRMGRRLAYAIDVDDAIRTARMPPLMLLTLVENAIKHGLTAVPAGGRIDVRARVQAGRLRVEVADTGGGFTKSGGAGAGLANIRARLAAEFGHAARLALTMNSPNGVVASIELPYLPIHAAAATP